MRRLIRGELGGLAGVILRDVTRPASAASAVRCPSDVIGFCFALALSALAGLAGESRPTTVDCHGVQVRLSALEPVQGSIVLLEVDGAASAGDLTLTWSGQPVRFWSERPEAPLRALVGIDLKRTPRAASLLLSSRDGP